MKRWTVLVAILLVGGSLCVAAQTSAVLPLTDWNWLGQTGALASAGAESAALTPAIAQVVNTLQTAMSAAQEAIDAAQAVQYQIQALQSLGQGNWQGFVTAMDDETNAVGMVSTAWSGLPSLDQIQQFASYTESEGYQQGNRDLQAAAENWANADALIHEGQAMVQGLAYRQKEMANIWSESQANSGASGGSLLKQLQLTTETLGLMQNDLADMENTSLAAEAYERGVEEEAQIQEQLDAQQIAHFYSDSPSWKGSVSSAQVATAVGLKF